MDTITLTNAQGRTVSVEYDWEQGRLAGCNVFDSSGAPIFARTLARATRRPALVTACSSGGTGTSADTRSFSYAYDAVGRPVERGADAFAYNARGEVTNATIDSAAWSYAYDHIGNRETATAPSGTTAYTANALNQYTAVDSWTPSYDLDGNLQGDGSLGYAWDAAGRLASARDPNAWRGDPWWSFEYDHRSRRVMKRNWTVLGNWSPPDGHSVYFYDGWNLVHEIRVSGSYQTSHVDYFWGPDLSGTLQGAGGVGGLVAVSINGFFYFPGYDNNGNVVGYWDESGSLVAEYAYDAFGNTIDSSGSMASVFPHRFSTKYYDSETDLYYYGYRYYSPELGRWISRDPIKEEGGALLYGFCRNNSVSSVDYLGNKIFVFSMIASRDDGIQAESIESEIRSADDWIENTAMGIVNWNQESYNKLNSENRWRINGTPFTGSQKEYANKIRREKESFYEQIQSDDFESAIRHIESRVGNATESYDRIGVVIHSGWDANLKKPDGLVWMGGNDGSLVSLEREKFLEALNQSPVLRPLKDRIVVVTCFQTWKEPEVRPNETPEAAAERARRESLEKPSIQLPKWECNYQSQPWYYNLIPFRFFAKIGE